jgi:integrase
VINRRVSRIRHVFKWAAAEELIEASVWHGLCAVSAVKAGRSGAVDRAAVGPAADEHVWKVIEHLPKTLAAMVQVQWLTGMRPGEVCSMRAMDLDMTGSVWLYRPAHHKTQHLGRSRIVLIGPRAQELLRPFLRRKMSAALFKPLEAMRQRFAQCKTHRREGQTAPVRVSTRRVTTAYDSTAYARAIRRVCRDIGVPEWSPNQLRHNAATRLRRDFGLDVAQVVLGHAHADVTQVYADVDRRKAIAVMERVG